MALGINDLDIYDDEFMENETQKQDVTEDDQINEGESSKEQETTTNVVTELLKRQGIEDPNQISFEKEDGSIEKLKWDDLSLEEQLNILNQKPENDDLPPVNDEIGEDIQSLAKELKDNNMSVDDFINYIKDQSIQGYQASLQPHYEVDNITDDDLFKIDLKNRIPDITPEQLETALEQAKSNEELYNKQVNGIREEYKQFEEEQNAQNEAITVEEQQQQYNEFANAITQTIDSLDNVNGIDIELEDEDKYELAQFILGQDAAGVSNFGKALNYNCDDPDFIYPVVERKDSSYFEFDDGEVFPHEHYNFAKLFRLRTSEPVEPK